MKKYFLILAVAITISSCSKLENLLTFNIDNTASFTVPASTGINVPVTIPTPDIPSNSSDVFENNNTNANLVKSVTLDKLELEITSPSNKTFSFLKSISISISADGLPQKEIASLNNIPASPGATLLLETSDVELDEYIKKESYSIITSVTTRESFFEDVDIDAKMRFKVTADLL